MKLILAETSEIAAALTAAELIATAGRYLRPLGHDNGTGITEQLEGLRLVARLAADGSAGTAWTRSDGDGSERTIWWSFFRTTNQQLLQRELAVFLASPAGQDLLSGVHADVTAHRFAHLGGADRLGDRRRLAAQLAERARDRVAVSGEPEAGHARAAVAAVDERTIA
jgi:hypothetical protein